MFWLQASLGDKEPPTCAVKAKVLLLHNDEYLLSFPASDILNFLLNAECDNISYVYWTVHHLYSCVKRKNQLDATYFII